MKKKFAEVRVGSEFEYGGRRFVKTEPNLAKDERGTRTLFHGEAEVEPVKHQGSQRGTAGDG